MKDSDILYIISPAYNEEANITRFIREWYPIVDQHQGQGLSRLVVIDDGSKDHTFDLLTELKSQYPLLDPLSKQNGGHGSALLYGYKYALDQGADYIFQTDSDLQTNPAEFDDFWKKREGFDAIFGFRPAREDGKVRVFVEKVLCLILKFFFHVSVPDANAPFRLMTSAYMRDLLPKIPDNYNLPNVMLVTYGIVYRKNIEFIPISFRPRENGTNSINIRRIVQIGLKSLKDFRQMSQQVKQGLSS